MTTYQKIPICITQEAWANSQLSIARYYGRIRYNGHTFWILDKQGRDLWECTHIANKESREYAIQPWESADLVRDDFRKVYRDLGREKFLEILKASDSHSDGEILKAMKAEVAKIKRRKK